MLIHHRAALRLSTGCSSTAMPIADANFLSADVAEVNAVDTPGGKFFDSIVDTGGISNVMPDSAVPRYDVVESNGSKSGQIFMSASGGKMPNQGQKIFPTVSQEGNVFDVVFQVAEVSKALLSVGEICDSDDGANYVVFTESGGYIAQPSQGCTTAFHRMGAKGAYLMRTWVPDLLGPSGGFARQG